MRGRGEWREEGTLMVPRGWRLTVAASCTVSASAGRRRAPPAPPSGPECRLSLSGVRLAFPTHYSSDGGQRGGCSVKSSCTKRPQPHYQLMQCGSGRRFQMADKDLGATREVWLRRRQSGTTETLVLAPTCPFTPCGRFALMFPMT